MRQLDGEAKKASANILKSLYESAASVKKQINTDKPEEAPKEEKEALIKKVQKPKVPHKEHIVEAADNTEVATFEIDYAPDDADLSTENSVIKSVKKWLGTLANEVKIEVLNLDGPGGGWPEVRLTGNKEKIGQFLNKEYNSGEDSLEDTYDLYLVECGNTNLTEAEGAESTESLRDKVAELQAYLDDTPEVPEDERASIQSQIDEILDEINYNENSSLTESSYGTRITKGTQVYWIGAGNEISSEGEVIDFPAEGRMTVKWDDGETNTYSIEHPDIIPADDYDNSINESSLNEAPNPENAEANKKIKDVMIKGPDSKFYQDVLNMGYNVEKDRYNKNSYIIVNPKKDSYRGNRTGKGSTLSAYPDENKNKGKRAISGERIKKMKADKRNAIDYKNALDKDYSPRSTGERLKFGSGKAPGAHSNQFVSDNAHTENTYDDYNQDDNYYNSNSGTKKIREYRRLRDEINRYEDPNYNPYSDKNKKLYRDAGYYGTEPKSYYDNEVKQAEKDLKDFQNSIANKIAKLQKEIDDAKSERDKARKNYNQNKKGIKKLLKKESEELTEARNPENDEANELIRTALNDPEYAKNHTSELRKHGIKYIPPEEGREWKGGALEGKRGRRLAINNNAEWRRDDIREIVDTSYSPYSSSYANGYSQENRDKDYEDLRQKTYAKSREDYNRARKNIDRQRTRVRNLENKDQFDSKVLKARDTLQNYEDTLKRGISADYKDTRKIHPDVDLKGFLNAKRHSDRPLARENDPKFAKNSYSFKNRRDKGDRIIDPSNRDLQDYKWAKSERKYLDKERERINQSNQEDQDRIKEMRKRFADDKARREKGFKAQEKNWKDVDSRIQNRLDNYRQKMSKK